MSKLKRLIIFLLVFVIALVSIPFGTVSAVNNPYLVFIETQKGQWTAYKEMTVLSPNGTVMIDANEFCNAIGFDFSSSSKTQQFIIKKSEACFNTYKLGNIVYTSCLARNKSTSKKAMEPAYYDKTLKMNLCDYRSIESLCYSKFFPLSNTTLRNSGYANVVCYSTYGIIKALPDISKLKYNDGIPLRDMGPVYKSPDGKWNTPIYYMDGKVNGVRKLWPTVSSYDYLNQRDKTGMKCIRVEYLPNHYNPKMPIKNVYDDPEFTLFISPDAKTGVIYSMKDCRRFAEDEKEPGKFDIFAFPVRSNGSPTFFEYEHMSGDNIFSETTVRFDTLDYEKGIAFGYIKIVVKGKGDGRVKLDVEGYFAEKFKDDADRPTDEQIYNQLHPNGTSESTSNTTIQQRSGNNSSPNIKLPTSKFVSCRVCGGDGRISCSSCGGFGSTEHMGYTYGQYGKVVDVCRMCGGTGSRNCTTCSGTGQVLVTSN